MERWLGLAVLVLSACGSQKPDGKEWIDPWVDHYELFTIKHWNWDILFVIDDSTSMAAVQDRLVGLAPVFESLNGEGCSGGAHPWTEFTYRIAFTTTDNGNPWCTSSPEAGDLVLQPCFERLDDFVSGDVDVRDAACLDSCALSSDELELAPTLVDGEDEPRVRPWIERIDGVSNLPPGTDVQDAFACLAPQGIAGCPFESPLESMRLGLERAATPEDPNFGFLRDDANLLVVFVTDSDDCSLAPGGEAIFDPEGEKVFWSNPDAESPTPAVCFNAGAVCMDDYCGAVNKDASGDFADPNSAVLHPIYYYYVDFLEALQEGKRSGAEVFVTVAGGFSSSGYVEYEESSDPEWQEQYGIGPGCTAQAVAAVPPVRLASLAGAYGESICEPDISGVLALPFEKTCQGWSEPCYPSCVLDIDPETPELDPECEVVMHYPGEDPEVLPECVYGPDGHSVPEDEDFCVVLAADAGNTECPYDGHNLQPKVVRRPDVWVRSGTRFLAKCTESPQPEIDCPPQ